MIYSGVADSDDVIGVVIGVVIGTVLAVVAVVGLGAAYVYFKARVHSRAPTLPKNHTVPSDSSLVAVPTASAYGTKTSVVYSNPSAALTVSGKSVECGVML